MTVDLNCDMGEMADGTTDERLIRSVTSANIACGGHAGDEPTMERTIRLALAARVAVGAHPGYPDRANFGRVEMPMENNEISRAVYVQVAALAAVAARLGATLVHVKPHGALYSVAVKNDAVAEAIARGVARSSRDLVLVGLAGSRMLDVWRGAGFAVAAEGFADRRYEPDGTLRSRSLEGAMITDPEEAAQQAVRLAARVQTICIHSDTEGSVEIAAAVRRALEQQGIVPAPLARDTSSGPG